MVWVRVRHCVWTKRREATAISFVLIEFHIFYSVIMQHLWFLLRHQLYEIERIVNKWWDIWKKIHKSLSTLLCSHLLLMFFFPSIAFLQATGFLYQSVSWNSHASCLQVEDDTLPCKRPRIYFNLGYAVRCRQSTVAMQSRTLFLFFYYLAVKCLSCAFLTLVLCCCYRLGD